MVHVLAVALSLDAGAASHFARLALRCARQEYPNKLDHVMNGAQEVLSPRALHPAFYGCFDWHSTVHGHWMLARLLRQFPQLPEAAEIRALLDEHLAPEAVAVEVAYFGQPNRKSFERTYFAKETEAPLKWEPGGEDFLSPSLEEAVLMARVLSRHEFRDWVKAFLPVARLTPAIVSDRTDPKIVHLDGLNLSRARCLYALAAALRRPALAQLADTHAQASLPFIASGSYEGEHWLGTFAVQMLDAREQGAQLNR